MGYYDNSWDELPKKIPYDIVIIVFAALIHLILPVPIYFYKKREQEKDQQQQHQFEHANNCIDPFNLHFKDFVLNYFIIFVMFTNCYVVVLTLNK